MQPRSENLIVLGQVVAGAKQLDVCFSEGRATLGPWEVVIKMKLVVGKLSKEPDETLNVVKEIGAEAGRTRFVEL
jgi:hypothetical protein